jgi:hypothetical protein
MYCLGYMGRSGADAACCGFTHVLALSASAWWRACICNERTIGRCVWSVEHAAACLDATTEWDPESEAVRFCSAHLIAMSAQFQLHHPKTMVQQRSKWLHQM